MRNHWNCTKFADKIRGVVKPEYATSNGWKDWEIRCKKEHPIRYWIVEECLEYIQNILLWPFDKFNAVRYYLVNRYITKTHALTSNMKRGDYWEMDTRILHCLFDELVNFVEVEKAWMQICWHDEKVDVPWYAVGPFRTRTYRSSELGLKYLEWEKTLKNDDGTPSEQAECATILMELYNWWKYIRPNRPDPYDESGWTEYCSQFESIFDFDNTDTKEMSEAIDRMEKAYYDEDEEMLIKLIKIRASLWT